MDVGSARVEVDVVVTTTAGGCRTLWSSGKKLSIVVSGLIGLALGVMFTRVLGTELGSIVELTTVGRIGDVRAGDHGRLGETGGTSWMGKGIPAGNGSPCTFCPLCGNFGGKTGGLNGTPKGNW